MMLIKTCTADEIRAVTQNLKSCCCAAKFKTMIIELLLLSSPSTPSPPGWSLFHRIGRARPNVPTRILRILRPCMLPFFILERIFRTLFVWIYKWSFLLLPSLFRYRYICVVFFNQKQGQNGLKRSAR